MRIDVHIHGLLDTDALQSLLERMNEKLNCVLKQGEKIMATLDETLAAVTDESTKEDSLIALMQGIKAQLDAVLAGQLPADVQAKVDAVFAGVTANSTKVQAAIDANTPAQPQP